MNSRGTLRRPSKVLSTIGKKAAMAMKATLAPSPRPNHIDSIGIQANSEICLSVWKDGPTRRSAQRDQPSNTPTASPALAPMAKPRALRHRLAESAVHSSPLVICCTARSHTAAGDTSRGEVDQPEATAHHQNSRISAGSTQPRKAGGTAVKERVRDMLFSLLTSLACASAAARPRPATAACRWPGPRCPPPAPRPAPRPAGTAGARRR